MYRIKNVGAGLPAKTPAPTHSASSLTQQPHPPQQPHSATSHSPNHPPPPSPSPPNNARPRHSGRRFCPWLHPAPAVWNSATARRRAPGLRGWGRPELMRNRWRRLGGVPQVEKVMMPRVLLRGGLIIGHLLDGRRCGWWGCEGMACQKCSWF